MMGISPQYEPNSAAVLLEERPLQPPKVDGSSRFEKDGQLPPIELKFDVHDVHLQTKRRHRLLHVVQHVALLQPKARQCHHLLVRGEPDSLGMNWVRRRICCDALHHAGVGAAVRLHHHIVPTANRKRKFIANRIVLKANVCK